MSTHLSPSPALVLVVDDEVEVGHVLTKALAMAGYEAHAVPCAEDALTFVTSRMPEVVITDYNMPGMKGDVLQAQLRALDPNLMVIMMTAECDTQLAINMLRDGIADYVLKPFSVRDVIARVIKAATQRAVLIEREELRRANQEHQAHLEEKVAAQSLQLAQAYRSSLLALNRALEVKDESTRNHSERVSNVASEIARIISGDDKAFVADITEAALLHDIGKIGVRESVLQKQGPLTIEEFREVQQHPLIGEQILRPIWNHDLKLKVVRNHHERWDGMGYPDRLAGEDISLGARIVAVADTWDALTSQRPYRNAQDALHALEVLREGRGTQWDPDVIDVALEVLGRGSFGQRAA